MAKNQDKKQGSQVVPAWLVPLGLISIIAPDQALDIHTCIFSFSGILRKIFSPA
jgi:hypothetical protein